MRAAPPPKTSADAFGPHVPGTLVAGNLANGWTDLLVEIYARRRVEEGLLVPAVAEPLVVWVLSGTARVEERELGAGDNPWTGRVVTAGEFFLTTTPTPYEVRWRVTGPEPFETMHAYVGLPLFARAAREVLGANAGIPALREVFWRARLRPFRPAGLAPGRGDRKPSRQRAFPPGPRPEPRRAPAPHLPGAG